MSAKSLYISRETEFEIWAVLGRLAVLKMYAILLKYPTFEGEFFVFSWKKQNTKLEFLCIVPFLCPKTFESTSNA